jgi:adenylyltransferase/sulfurtransferase
MSGNEEKEKREKGKEYPSPHPSPARGEGVSVHSSQLTAHSSSERYNRNILIPQISEEGQKKLLQAKILVCGAGGLGSTVLTNLASVGIGTIGIVDNDVLELSNLNRQYIHKFDSIGKVKVESTKKWINEFNPEITVNTYQTRLDENNYQDIVKDYDFIMDCFDSFKSKFLLNKIAVSTGKTLIHGGVTEFFGQVSVIVPTKTACLNCILPGNLTMEAYIIKGVISPAVATIASIEAMEAVKLILNIGESLQNKLLSYNGLTMQFKTINIEKNPHCNLCSNK